MNKYLLNGRRKQTYLSKREREEFISILPGVVNSLICECDKNKELREALEFYGDMDNYLFVATQSLKFEFLHTKVNVDHGRKARAALGLEK